MFLFQQFSSPRSLYQAVNKMANPSEDLDSSDVVVDFTTESSLVASSPIKIPAVSPHSTTPLRPSSLVKSNVPGSEFSESVQVSSVIRPGVFLAEDQTVLEFLALMAGHTLCQALLYEEALLSRHQVCDIM